MIDNQHLRKKAGWISFSVGLLMLVMKMGGYLLTNSAAILSDALESVVHVIATGITLYSIILVGRPADRKHPYGYGKAEYFSAGMEGGLIMLAAVAILYEAIGDIIRGSQLQSVDIGVAVVAVAGTINLVLGFYLLRTGKRTRSLALVADGKHVLTDSYTSIGVLVGLLLVKVTGVTLLDPLFAIGVALNIVYTGYSLVNDSISGLMNTADPDMLDRVVAVMNRIRTPDIIDIHRLRAWRAGEHRFIDFHLTLPYYFQLSRVHEVQHQVQNALEEEFEGLTEVLIHFDPCSHPRCVICGRSDCDVRHQPFEHPADFTVQSAQSEPLLDELT